MGWSEAGEAARGWCVLSLGLVSEVDPRAREHCTRRSLDVVIRVCGGQRSEVSVCGGQRTRREPDAMASPDAEGIGGDGTRSGPAVTGGMEGREGGPLVGRGDGRKRG